MAKSASVKKTNYWVLFLASIFLPVSCDQNRSDPTGYWRDSTGMALFQVIQDTSNTWILSSSLGSLRGIKDGNSIRGTTDLGDSFSLTVQGNRAIYSVLGVTIEYQKIQKTEFDSLSQVLQTP